MKVDTFGGAQIPPFKAGKGCAALSINPEQTTVSRPRCRRIDYLRLSITDRCNLNCLYCMPVGRFKFLHRGEILSYEEMYRAVEIFVEAGVKRLRITGGEPLLKRDLIVFIKMLKRIKGLEEITMTTNGVYLKDNAGRLADAGLDRINISLDTLRQDRFKTITGADALKDVWLGIGEAISCGLNPVKLNVILLKGLNDDEILDFVRLSADYPLIVRFIEFFPTNKRSRELLKNLVTSQEIKEKIVRSCGDIEPISGIKGSGPAQYFKLNHSKGAFGFISSFTKDFCHACNRIRVDCSGRILPCLFEENDYNMKPYLRENKNRADLLEYIKNIFAEKQGRKDLSKDNAKVEMSSIGG